MKAEISIDTIRLPHGSGGVIKLKLATADETLIFQGDADCAKAVYDTLVALRNANVDLSTAEILLSETRS